MSDHEMVSDTGYDTPVPELDDHRHPSHSQRERPRRGTFDSLYRTRHMDHEPPSPGIRLRDFEEAVSDDEDGRASPVRRGRRGTVDTTAERAMSPPNSVKAFAQARRRERDLSFSDPTRDRDGDDRSSHNGTVASRRSLRSRPYTMETDKGSLLTNKSAEEDVCFPLQENRRKDQLQIDFDYLESFIQAERDVHLAQRQVSNTAEEFDDLRAQHGAMPDRLQLATSDGDIIEMPIEKPPMGGKSDSPITMTTTTTTTTDDEKMPQLVDHNRFSFFSSAWESTIHAAEMADLVLPGEDIRGLFDSPNDESPGVWWLNINGATKGEVQGICRAFGIHPLTIEDIITQEAREKIELFPAYYFACFRSFHVIVEPDGKEYEPFNIYVIVFREGTLSFSFAPNTHASDVRKRITALKDYVSLSSDWICYALIDNIVDSFGPVIRQIELEADAIEDEVFVLREDDSSSFLRSIGQARKNTMALLRLLGGKADVLRGFTKRCNENYQVTPRMDIGMYLGDIQDHVVTMANNLGHFEKMLSRAHSNYLATLSINNISQGTATNQVLSKMTFLASVLVPLNLICGVFGMNVAVPFKDSASLGPFFGIIAIMILVCSIILFWAHRAKWI